MRRMLRAFPVVLVLLALASLALLPRRGVTTPLYAARQGLLCQNCHFDPNGGGPRNEFGFAFAKNRHSLEADTSGAWKDLDLTNRVGEKFPLYFGVNQRFMVLADRLSADRGVDLAGFYDMESALHMAFQPHPRLTLVYTHDGFDSNSRSTREAYGLIGLSDDAYLRAGQFRVPFGLRLDDHTVATRNSFLEAYSDPIRPARFLPYDPRGVDRGVELGGTHGIWYGRASITNGTSHPLLNPINNHAQAFASKFGVNVPMYQSGLSFYDEWSRAQPGGFRVRATRWGYYGMTHAGPLALLGEIAAGTDAFTGANPGDPDVKTNRLAAFAELDWAPARQWNFRVRMDRLEIDRSSDPVLRDLGTFSRYALEGEVVPVPFAEIRWALRLIDPVAKTDPFSLSTIRNEKQGFVQFHFSY